MKFYLLVPLFLKFLLIIVKFFGKFDTFLVGNASIFSDCTVWTLKTVCEELECVVVILLQLFIINLKINQRKVKICVIQLPASPPVAAVRPKWPVLGRMTLPTLKHIS